MLVLSNTLPQVICHKQHCCCDGSIVRTVCCSQSCWMMDAVATNSGIWQQYWPRTNHIATHHFFAPVHLLKRLCQVCSTLAVVEHLCAFCAPHVRFKLGWPLLVCTQLLFALGACFAAGVNLGCTFWAVALGSRLAACGRLCRTAPQMRTNYFCMQRQQCAAWTAPRITSTQLCLHSGPRKLAMTIQPSHVHRGTNAV